jgi:hypothetical protein
VSRRVWIIPIVIAVLLALVPAVARVMAADAPSLYVTWHAGPQRLTTTLANGTPVGTTSGAPTVIAPGFYNLIFDDSAAVEGPGFELKGPGVNVYEDLFFGEIQSGTLSATFLPSSTYTWRNVAEQPNVVFTFVTSSDAGASGSGSGGLGSTVGGTTKTGTPAKSIVGSDVVPFRGKLAATVDAAGRLALTTKGRPVATLKTGLYTFTVVDKSAKKGFSIQKLKSSAIALTGVAYKGTHVKTLNLKAGQWTFFSPSGTKNYFIVVK